MTLLNAVKKFFSLGLPMAGTQLIHVSGGFLCMTMLAHLGQNVLAASALIYATQIGILVPGLSILFCISILVSHANGAQNYFSIGNYVQQGYILAVIISVPIILFFWHIKAILIFLGQRADIAEIVQTFFHAFVWAVIPNCLSTCNQQFGYGIHKKALIVIASLLGIVVCVGSAYVLIFGKFGFPKLGVAGLAYAQTAQMCFFFIFTSLVYYFDKKNFDRYQLFKFRVHKHLDHFKQMLKIGGPICAQMGGEIFALFVISIMVGWLGTTALAAAQIANQYYFLVIIPLFVFSQAGSILIGHANGAKQYDEIKLLGKASLLINLMITLGVAIIFTGFTKYLISAYINIHDPNNKTVLYYAVILLYAAAGTIIFDSTRNMLIGLSRGLFDTKVPMIMGLVLCWLIELPLCYILAFVFKLGVIGIALGGLFAMILGAGMMYHRWYELSKKYN